MTILSLGRIYALVMLASASPPNRVSRGRVFRHGWRPFHGKSPPARTGWGEHRIRVNWVWRVLITGAIAVVRWALIRCTFDSCGAPAMPLAWCPRRYRPPRFPQHPGPDQWPARATFDDSGRMNGTSSRSAASSAGRGKDVSEITRRERADGWISPLGRFIRPPHHTSRRPVAEIA